MRVVNGYREAVRGRFDAVAMFDVLYRFPVEEWASLFAQVRACLDLGGVFLLKDMDPGRRGKAAWNRVQETLAGWAKLGLGDGYSFETTAMLSTRLRAAGFSTVEVRAIDRGFPHPHVLYLARG
jgi:cyclopropane fatty-acyl-phospholipid synthase-like methyltransferase